MSDGISLSEEDKLTPIRKPTFMVNRLSTTTYLAQENLTLARVDNLTVFGDFLSPVFRDPFLAILAILLVDFQGKRKKKQTDVVVMSSKIAKTYVATSYSDVLKYLNEFRAD